MRGAAIVAPPSPARSPLRITSIAATKAGNVFGGSAAFCRSARRFDARPEAISAATRSCGTLASADERRLEEKRLARGDRADQERGRQRLAFDQLRDERRHIVGGRFEGSGDRGAFARVLGHGRRPAPASSSRGSTMRSRSAVGELAEQDLAHLERQIVALEQRQAQLGAVAVPPTMRSSEKRGTRAPRLVMSARQAAAVPTSPIAAETARDRNGRQAIAICIVSPRVATMSTSSLSRMTGECSATSSATCSVSAGKRS